MEVPLENPPQPLYLKKRSREIKKKVKKKFLKFHSRTELFSESVNLPLDPFIEFLVSGEVKVISDPGVRAQSERFAGSPVVIDSYVLFEFQVERVLVVEYDSEMKPVVRRWSRS